MKGGEKDGGDPVDGQAFRGGVYRNIYADHGASFASEWTRTIQQYWIGCHGAQPEFLEALRSRGASPSRRVCVLFYPCTCAHSDRELTCLVMKRAGAFDLGTRDKLSHSSGIVHGVGKTLYTLMPLLHSRDTNGSLALER